jgi:hypothetical protein
MFVAVAEGVQPFHSTVQWFTMLAAEISAPPIAFNDAAEVIVRTGCAEEMVSRL